MKNLRPLNKAELKTVMGGDKCSCQTACPWMCKQGE
ncbi:protein with bacteriocin-type signal sequence [Chryseobacterium sp. PMSZPI]